MLTNRESLNHAKQNILVDCKKFCFSQNEKLNKIIFNLTKLSVRKVANSHSVYLHMILFSGLQITIDTDDGLKNITIPESNLTIGADHQFEIKQEYNNQTKFMIDVIFDGQLISNDEITFPMPARTDNQITCSNR